MICDRLICVKCGREFQSEIIYDESGFGYSAKIVKCPKCGAIRYIEVTEDQGLDVNHDERFYRY